MALYLTPARPTVFRYKREKDAYDSKKAAEEPAQDSDSNGSGAASDSSD